MKHPSASIDFAVRRASTILVVLCAVVLAGTLTALAVPAVKSRFFAPILNPPAYRLGDTIDLPSSVLSSTERTVLVFSRADCGACLRSKPEVGRLNAELADQPSVQVVLVTPLKGRQGEAAFASEVGVDEKHQIPTDLARLHLRFVPTVIVADKSGRVLAIHEGVLTEADREEIVEAALRAPAVAS